MMANKSKNEIQTINAFEFQWKKLAGGLGSLEDLEFREHVEELIQAYTGLPKEWFENKDVLDAGCGSGRLTYGLCKLKANVTAIDVTDSAVMETAKNCSIFPNLKVEKSDIITHRSEKSFDLILCFGVLHHIRHPSVGFERLASHVKPGGYLFIYVYGKRSIIYRVAMAAARAFLFPLSFEKQRNILQLVVHIFELIDIEDLSARIFGRPLAVPRRETIPGWFGALAPAISTTHHEKGVFGWFKENGFETVTRTVPSKDHYLIGRKGQDSDRRG